MAVDLKKKEQWKEPLAMSILEELNKLDTNGALEDCIDNMISYDDAGKLKISGIPLPGYMGSIVTPEELEKAATSGTSVRLWWCRAVAAQKNLSIPFMDWVFFNK